MKSIERYIMFKVGKLYVENMGNRGVSLTDNPVKAHRIDENRYTKRELIALLLPIVNILERHGLDVTLEREVTTITAIVSNEGLELKVIGDKLDIMKVEVEDDERN